MNHLNMNHETQTLTNSPIPNPTTILNTILTTANLPSPLTSLNPTILDSFQKAISILSNPTYKSISCSISGGADSDVMLDLIHRVHTAIHTTLPNPPTIHYTYFDTGLEYQATKDHIKYLQDKYNITIQTLKPTKSIPTSCREHGQPFISKYVSEMIQRLQRHNFHFQDLPYETLLQQYPKCKSALKWWCNIYTKENDNKMSHFSIEKNSYLKEFMVANPPTFPISSKCCDYAKKNLSAQAVKEYDLNLVLIGVRKAEKGARSTIYSSCFSYHKHDKVNHYRPLFWYTDQDRKEYEQLFNVTHSACYTTYNLPRTGCAGCPYSLNQELELETIKTYEPKLYLAVNNIFKDSYDYTNRYHDFRNQMKEKKKHEK